MSRAPCRRPARCCFRFAMEDSLPSMMRVDARPSLGQEEPFPYDFVSVKSGLADASGIDPWYAFLKRTRTSQKISKTSGRTVRSKYNGVLNRAGDKCCPSPTAESNLSGRFDGPRKKDPAAMNRPKHMRQRCRAMRFVPKTPPRTSMRRSPAPASSITEPMKKVIPTGTPSSELAPLRTTFKPVIQVRIPSVKGIRRTAQSKRLVFPPAHDGGNLSGKTLRRFPTATQRSPQRYEQSVWANRTRSLPGDNIRRPEPERSA